MRAALILLAACGAQAVPSQDLASFFAAERVADAQREAPDLLAEAEHARADAEEADRDGDTRAAEDHATRARLLLDAALVEAERASLERARLEAQAETERATAAAVAAHEARRAREETESRERAAAVARGEIERAFAQAELDEARRFRRRQPEQDEARRQAAIALANRTRIVLVAAQALGASESEAAAVANDLPTPTAAALPQVIEAHRAALALLGTARQAHPVDEAARGALVRALEERRFAIDLRAEGVVTQVDANAARAAALAAVASAHPHGPLMVRGRRATTLGRLLTSAGVPQDRLQTANSDAELEVFFSAYGAE